MQIKATANVPADLAKKLKVPESIVESFNVDLPGTLDGYNKQFGADVILDLVKKAIVIAYQAYARGKMLKREEGAIVGVGLRGKALQESIDGYKPSLRKAGKSFLEKAREKAKSMTDEEKKALIAELTGQGGGGAPKGAAPVRRAAAPARRPAAQA